MSITEELVSDPTLQKTPRIGRLAPLLALAALFLLASVSGYFSPDWNVRLVTVAVSLFLVATAVGIKGRLADRSARQATAIMTAFAEQETTPCIVANGQGLILLANAEARHQLHAQAGVNIADCLRSVFANPSALLLRLQSLADAQSSARDDVVTQQGSTPVSVFRIGTHMYCWRIFLAENWLWEDAELPVLTEGRNGVVLRANKAAQEFFGSRPVSTAQIFPDGLPDDNDVCQVKSASAQVDVITSQLSRSGASRTLALVPVHGARGDSDALSFSEFPVPIICLAPDGTIIETNRLAEKLLGGDCLAGSDVGQIMQGLGQPIAEWIDRTSTGENTPRSEFVRLTRQDKEIFVQVTLSHMMQDGQARIIAVLNDATELKTLEAQFVQGQKMQAVGQLAGGVAHDFNNLLTAISGHCDLLLLRHDQNDPNYGDLVQINQNANRAAALVSQLLAFSRKQTLRPENLDLRDTISDLIHLLNRLVGEKVQLTLSHDPILKPVRADKRQLEQVLMNLVVNARDAMPEGGEIRIETEVRALDEPLRRDRATVPPGEYVTVKVIDSGVGIPADKLQKVFEPFYTTKRTGEGTGLGLSTVYGIVKQTGGFIFVDSRPGRGSEFTVILPVCPVAKEVKTQPPEKPDVQIARQGEGVVLLVEDEAPVRAFATRALRLKGYTVLEAESAEDALQLLEDPDLGVDVFVTDVVMPGMDGPTWVRKAQETRPGAKVIFVSGYTEGVFGEAGPDVANSTFLPKPFSLSQLTEAVFQQLD